MIEDASTVGASLGLGVWCGDEAGPFRAVPHPGPSWQPEGRPARPPHAYVRGGTAEILAPFRPADGHVRVEGTTTCPSAVSHPWAKRESSAIPAALPAPPPTADTSRAAWDRWQAGLTRPITRPAAWPPPRVLLVLDTRVDHYERATPARPVEPVARLRRLSRSPTFSCSPSQVSFDRLTQIPLSHLLNSVAAKGRA